MEVTAAKPSGIAANAFATSSAWDLLFALTMRDLRVRYQGTVLSYVWWIARPLALGAVLYFALGQVLRLGIPNYSVFLLSALFPWFWFASTLQQATGSFVNNSGLLRKVVFPRLILPLSAVLYNTVQFLLTLPVLALFVLISGIEPHITWALGIPILMLLQIALLVGLATLLSSLNVFFRDLEPLVEVSMTIGFYASPIIYSMDLVPDRFRPILMLNPIAPLLEAWRQLFIEGELPGADLWPAVALTVIALVLGMGIFRSLERHFADAL